jgi:hypothetical protein
MTLAQQDVDERRHLYEQMAGVERHTPIDTSTDGSDHDEKVVVEEDAP